MSKFALLFVGVLLAGLGTALFYHGWAAFLLYEVTYFMNPDDRWWSSQLPGVSYSFWVAILMLLVLGRRYVTYSQASPWLAHPSLKWLILLLGCYYLAFFWAIRPQEHDQFTYAFFKLVVIVLVAYKLLNTRAALNGAIWAFLVGCAYIGYLATELGRNMGTRLEGITLPDSPDVNGVANTLAPAGVFLIYYAWMGSNKVRLLSIVCAAFIANGLVLFNSRGAFLGAATGVGLYLLLMLFSRHQQKGQRFLAVLVIAFGIGGAISVTDDVFWERMGTLSNLESRQSGSGRITYWLTTFEMMDDHPMGMGVRGYNALASFYMSAEERGNDSGRGRYRAVHSLWFQGLSEVGWHGLGIFLILLWTLFRTSRHAKKHLIAEKDFRGYFHLSAIECALVGYLVTGSFIDQFRSEVLYWMILFVAVATNVYYLQPLQASDADNKEAGSFPVVGKETIA